MNAACGTSHHHANMAAREEGGDEAGNEDHDPQIAVPDVLAGACGKRRTTGLERGRVVHAWIRRGRITNRGWVRTAEASVVLGSESWDARSPGDLASQI
jgi:hypothetical protein